MAQYFKTFDEDPPEGWADQWITSRYRVSGDGTRRSVFLQPESGIIPNWPDTTTDGPLQIGGMGDWWWVRKRGDDGREYLIGEPDHDAAAKRLLPGSDCDGVAV